MFLFLVTPCLVVAAQPCIEQIPIKKRNSSNNNSQHSFQSLSIFGYKELHIRCCTRLKLNIVISTKILRGIGGHSLWSSATLGKICKTHSSRSPKKHLQSFNCIRFYAFNIKWTKEVISTHWLRLLLCYKCLYSIYFLVKMHNNLISSIVT